MTPHIDRDQRSGRFIESKLVLRCKCGHPLGYHTAAGTKSSRPCLNHEVGDGAECPCVAFKKAKVQP